MAATWRACACGGEGGVEGLRSAAAWRARGGAGGARGAGSGKGPAACGPTASSHSANFTVSTPRAFAISIHVAAGSGSMRRSFARPPTCCAPHTSMCMLIMKSGCGGGGHWLKCEGGWSGVQGGCVKKKRLHTKCEPGPPMMTICWNMLVERGVRHPSKERRLRLAGTNAHDSACAQGAGCKSRPAARRTAHARAQMRTREYKLCGAGKAESRGGCARARASAAASAWRLSSASPVTE